MVQWLRGFFDSSVGKESTCNAGDPSSIPGSGRSTGKGVGYSLQYSWASLVAQLVKNPPAMRETWIQSLDWEDALEKGKATHSSILAWRTLWTVQSMGSQESDTTEPPSLHFHCTSHGVYKSREGFRAKTSLYCLCFPSLQASCGLLSCFCLFADFILIMTCLMVARSLSSATRITCALVDIEEEPPPLSCPHIRL